MPRAMQSLSDYDYVLPGSLIAQAPAAKRSDSRLLVFDRQRTLHDQLFHQLPQWLCPGDLLVINDSSVLKARLRARKPSGAAVEVLIERVIGPRQALALLGSNKKLKVDQRLEILNASVIHDDSATHPASAIDHGPETLHASRDRVCDAVIIERRDMLFVIEFEADPYWLMQTQGSLPLPPYIGGVNGRQDEQRYQTVYGSKPGSIAAPTAGLHFDDALLAHLQQQDLALARLTLHVGLGTFLPVRENQIDKHRMHAELFELSETCAEAITQTRQRGGRVIAVGTTSLRTLESCADPQRAGHVIAQRGETSLFIRPGYRFQICDGLITNFHLPQSTLLMLVSAFVGFESVKQIYAHAIAKQYRFFSYGDACLFFRTVTKAQGPQHA
ncbi:MAG: tRNA preQ1(34) S-adenosylmethionine ribosyltransferase-isomerase QueA [Betaproteobacteria bacterium]|nr:tRNA preQ1(34) S-adenosylmethionine ribosyltransferase-isomerase QueA [Betaproteobacteria bacterium]NCZ82630.1 tRNA preQ1(34) S-adenosylmethionine ribosyltransferase-isomerase QueA [Betaproteobacteria bacterium]